MPRAPDRGLHVRATPGHVSYSGFQEGGSQVATEAHSINGGGNDLRRRRWSPTPHTLSALSTSRTRWPTRRSRAPTALGPTSTARVQSLWPDIFDGMYSPSSAEQGTVLSHSLPLTLARSTGLEPSTEPSVYIESLVYRLSLRQVRETKGATRTLELFNNIYNT